MLNEDYLVNSQYLHVRHGVAVAENPPTISAKEEIAWNMSLGENLERTQGGSPQEPHRWSCVLKTKLVAKILCYVIFCLRSAGEPNVCSYCYSMPYMKIPAINQVILSQNNAFTIHQIMIQQCLKNLILSLISP